MGFKYIYMCSCYTDVRTHAPACICLQCSSLGASFPSWPSSLLHARSCSISLGPLPLGCKSPIHTYLSLSKPVFILYYFKHIQTCQNDKISSYKHTNMQVITRLSLPLHTHIHRFSHEGPNADQLRRTSFSMTFVARGFSQTPPSYAPYPHLDSKVT